MGNQIFINEKSYEAENLHFFYDNQQWWVEFLGYEGFGENSEEAMYDLINFTIMKVEVITIVFPYVKTILLFFSQKDRRSFF